MLSIGDFARLGRVSVRMLRHYDAIGLLLPAEIDQRSGYRWYAADQLERLNRIVALKDLGFGLDEVQQLVDHRADDHGAALLQQRQQALIAEYRLAQSRLDEVERRLHILEREQHMSQIECVIKPLRSRRLAAGRAHVESQPEIGPVISALFGEVAAAVEQAGGHLEHPVAVYTSEPDDEQLHFVAGYDYAGDPGAGFDIVELGAFDEAMCAVHLGSMEGIAQSWQSLHTQIAQKGYRPSGPCREVYVRAWPHDDQSGWVTELQQPVERA